jgi:drug/metabolite transporter (DMT)-like permease
MALPNVQVKGWKHAAALGAIYFVWGSTYFAIRVAVESIPPLLAAGARFLIAGLLLYGWALLRDCRPVERRQWRGIWLLGALMFLVSYSLLFSAEKTVPSGIASVLIATLPVWVLLFEATILKTQRVTPYLAGALAVGLIGVALLSGSSGTAAKPTSWIWCVGIVVSAISWSAGTILSRRLNLPASHSISAGAQMICGGLLLLLFSGVIGEWKGLRVPPLAAVGAMLYLIVAGSLIAYGSYVWLLQRMSPTRLSSYAYVNPVVALAIGWLVGGERLRLTELAGAALVLTSVVLILKSKSRSKEGPQEDPSRVEEATEAA